MDDVLTCIQNPTPFNIISFCIFGTFRTCTEVNRYLFALYILDLGRVKVAACGCLNSIDRMLIKLVVGHVRNDDYSVLDCVFALQPRSVVPDQPVPSASAHLVPEVLSSRHASQMVALCPSFSSFTFRRLSLNRATDLKERELAMNYTASAEPFPAYLISMISHVWRALVLRI